RMSGHRHDPMAVHGQNPRRTSSPPSPLPEPPETEPSEQLSAPKSSVFGSRRPQTTPNPVHLGSRSIRGKAWIGAPFRYDRPRIRTQDSDVDETEVGLGNRGVWVGAERWKHSRASRSRPASSSGACS